MEMVKLFEIVNRWCLEMFFFLKLNEFDLFIVFWDGLGILEQGDVMEIIQYSICEYQNDIYI